MKSFSSRKGLVPSTFLLLILLTGFGLSGCGNSGKSGGDPANGIEISGTLTNCFGDSIFLYELVGTDSRKIATGAITKDKQTATFNMKVKVPHTGFYSLGTGPRSSATLILGEEGAVTFTGDCFDMPRTSRVQDSPVNEAYADLNKRMNELNNRANQTIQNLRTFSMTNPPMVPQLQQDLMNIQQEKSSYLDSIITAGGYVGKIASLLQFKPYGSDPSHSQYPDELTYFLKGFMTGMDLADPDMAYIPQYSDRFRQYVMNLVQQNQPREAIISEVDKALASVPKESQNYLVALTGVLIGFDQTQSDLYLDYGKQYLELYPQETEFTAGLRGRISALERFAIGAEAPEINLPDQNGNPLTLSSLRGKYVMIDFWASWCRPCRAENPNVVRLYKQYHTKGFEVLGVSLDRERTAWLAAIQQDGLDWKHVSDLKFWQSEAAQIYSVSSIPMTFLLDKDGKIIGKNLRGPALEAKLKELFNS